MSKRIIVKSTGVVTNFMDGVSYRPNPLLTLKMVSASSFFGEPQYYRNGADGDAVLCSILREAGYTHSEMRIIEELYGQYENSAQLMERLIDKSLDYDFEGTVRWAFELRDTYFVRVTPQVIMVRASVHPGRKEFTQKNPGVFGRLNNDIMSRADEPGTQLEYWNSMVGTRTAKGIPPVLRRSWKKRLEDASHYEINKYGNSKMINAIRVSHAGSPAISKLLREGIASEGVETWEQLRSAGAKWSEIVQKCRLGHMALLRNLRGIFTEGLDEETESRLLKQLVDGSRSGKQMPYRYYSAYKTIMISNVKNKESVLKALENCLSIVVDQLPRLDGVVVALTDNSGSAFTPVSKQSAALVYEVDNLSSVIAASRGDEGYIVAFGDRHKVYKYDSGKGILEQALEINKSSSRVGTSTEAGIWTYLLSAIKNKQKIDHLFVYSDQQAGYGQLYGYDDAYTDLGLEVPTRFTPDKSIRRSGQHVCLQKVMAEYRSVVNPKVLVSSIQTAGYDNNVLPENLYRTNLLYGWTGKEIEYHKLTSELWDQLDALK